jgi:hypothetical protein
MRRLALSERSVRSTMIFTVSGNLQSHQRRDVLSHRSPRMMPARGRTGKARGRVVGGRGRLLQLRRVTSADVRAILALAADWPLSGSLAARVLERLHAHASARPLTASAETGAGKSTLLLSQVSAHHTVFTKDDTGDGDSLAGVRASPLLRREAVEFVVGPTQATLPAHCFARALDLVLIDGAHGFPFPQLDYYFLYRHLAPGGLLVLDDIQIRSVNDLFRFLRADAMFDLLEVVRTTAFFRRTAAPVFDPHGDGWWLQGYNLRAWPPPAGLGPLGLLRALVPLPAKEAIRSLRAGYVPIAARGAPPTRGEQK